MANTTHYQHLLSQLQALMSQVHKNVLTPFSSPSEVSAYKQTIKRQLALLSNELPGLRAANADEGAAFDTAMRWAELDYLTSLAKIERTPQETHDRRTREICVHLLGQINDEADRIALVATGLGASLNEPAERSHWLLRAKGILDQYGTFTAAVSTLAHNYVMGMALGGGAKEAEGALQLLDMNQPEECLLAAGVRASCGNIEECVRCIVAYFDGSDADTSAPTNAQRVARYATPDRALVLMSWGQQGIYALVWSCGNCPVPKYLPLLGLAEAGVLKAKCASLPWAHMLDPKRTTEAGQQEFTPRDYDVLQEIWRLVLNPVLQECGQNAGMVDIIPIGWLALVPWTACGKNPALAECVGEWMSIGIQTTFGSPESSAVADDGRHGGGRFIVCGDYTDIEDECKREEARLVEMGFRSIESRCEIFVALQHGAIVHFNGHGIFPPAVRRDMTPHFRLKDGSPMTITDLQTGVVGTTPPLVSFSACELGFCYFAEGLAYGFPGWFLCKGTSACVAPVGRITAPVAAEYFPAFYERVLAGDSVASAARYAFNLRGSAGRGKRNLGYWSPFMVYGNQTLTARA